MSKHDELSGWEHLRDVTPDFDPKKWVLETDGFGGYFLISKEYKEHLEKELGFKNEAEKPQAVAHKKAPVQASNNEQNVRG